MNGSTMLTMAVAAVVLISGLAAVGAASPVDDTPETGDDVSGVDAAEDDVGGAANEGAAAVGPSGGLPEQVPDLVGDIHETIGSFLDGSIDGLGDALGGGEQADAGTDDARSDVNSV